MTWICTVCKRPREFTDGPPLATTLNASYKQGRCKQCDRPRAFIEQRADDLDEGRRLRDQGMDRANNAEAASGDWPQRFDAALDEMARSGAPFTSEDVTERSGSPVSSGAVGARMNAAAKRGDIEWTGNMAQSRRARSHAALLKVWQGSWAVRESAS